MDRQDAPPPNEPARLPDDPAWRRPADAPKPRRDDSAERKVRRARRGRVAKVLLALAVVVILIIFITANAQGVEVDFVFGTGHPPMIWVMVSCLVIGGIVGYFVGRPGKEIRDDREPDRTDKPR